MEPSSEFSIGTSASSTAPSSRTSTASRMLATATGSTLPGRALVSSASSLNVPAGPR